MSNFTLSLYDIVNSVTYNNYDKTPKERIVLALPYIFDFDYPIWNVDYKKTLEKKIIFKYLTEEICFSSFDLWKISLEEKLNSIMPYYNKLYDSILDYDITKNYSIETKIIEESTNHNSLISNTLNVGDSEIISNSHNKRIDSETPQGIINTSDDGYASFLSDNNGSDSSTNTNNLNSDTTQTNNSNSGKNSTNITNGNNTYIADLILKHRETIINIDKMIVDELKDLFMMIY